MESHPTDLDPHFQEILSKVLGEAKESNDSDEVVFGTPLEDSKEESSL